MAESLQRLYVERESLRWHLEGFLDVRASFLPGILHKICKEEISAGDNNGIFGSHQYKWPNWMVNYQPNLPATLIDRA